MPVHRPEPLASWNVADRRRVRGVLTDIDDTLTTDGAITGDALQALARLAAAGVPVIAITGRPQGWSEPFAMQWPIEAIVAENGAVALRRDGDRLRIDYQQDAATLALNRQRLREAAARVLADVPGVALSRDSPGRVTDIAIDHGEFARLSSAQIDQVVAVMQRLGLHATVSSIHINGWFGDHDKPSGARWIVRTLFERELDDERDAWVYVGDSTNDQGMFSYLPQSMGVANLMRFADVLGTWPAFITSGERGAGFSEVVDALLDAPS